MVNGHYWAREKGWSFNYSYNSLDLCSIESYDSVNLVCWIKWTTKVEWIVDVANQWISYKIDEKYTSAIVPNHLNHKQEKIKEL